MSLWPLGNAHLQKLIQDFTEERGQLQRLVPQGWLYPCSQPSPPHLPTGVGRPCCRSSSQRPTEGKKPTPLPCSPHLEADPFPSPTAHIPHWWCLYCPGEEGSSCPTPTRLYKGALTHNCSSGSRAWSPSLCPLLQWWETPGKNRQGKGRCLSGRCQGPRLSPAPAQPSWSRQKLPLPPRQCGS